MDCQYIWCPVGVDECYLGGSQFYFVIVVEPALCPLVLIDQCSVNVVFHGGVVIATRHIQFCGNRLRVEGEDATDVEVAVNISARSATLLEVVVVAAIAEGSCMVFPDNLVAIGQHVGIAVGQCIAFLVPLMSQSIYGRCTYNHVVCTVVLFSPYHPGVGCPGLVATAPRRGQRHADVDETDGFGFTLDKLGTYNDARFGEGKDEFV